MGELHLEIIVDRLLREFKVEANVGKPQVAYRETITQAARRPRASTSGRPGGKGQYGHVWLRVVAQRARARASPSRTRSSAARCPRSSSRRWSRASGGACSNGPLAGYPMVDVKVEAFDGCFHDVDSNEIAFRIAGSMAFREGGAQGRAGAARADHEDRGRHARGLHGRRHWRPERPAGEDPGHGRRSPAERRHIQAQVPLATMFGYATDLRSRTQGRATYTMQFSHYAAVPKPVADEIVARIRGH